MWNSRYCLSGQMLLDLAPFMPDGVVHVHNQMVVRLRFIEILRRWHVKGIVPFGLCGTEEEPQSKSLPPD
jgi:hypothetical protein